MRLLLPKGLLAANQITAQIRGATHDLSCIQI